MDSGFAMDLLSSLWDVKTLKSHEFVFKDTVFIYLLLEFS